MMTKVLVYGYCVGVFSSRRLERCLIEDVAFRILAAGSEPDFRTFSEFRRIEKSALRLVHSRAVWVVGCSLLATSQKRLTPATTSPF
jgi:transposase